jgi:putative DNA primase/helicase
MPRMKLNQPPADLDPDNVTEFLAWQKAHRKAAPGQSTDLDPDLVRADDLRAERIRWVWPGYLPAGKVVIIDGDPGTGKSTMALDLGARISRGGSWPDDTRCGRGNVIIFSAEDGAHDTIRPRLLAARADMTRMYVDSSDLRLPDDITRIEDKIRRRGARLVVFDVLMSYLGAAVNAHRDQDMRTALRPLTDVAGRTGACIIAIRHLNKTPGLSAMYRGGGSIGIIGQARAAYLVAPLRDNPDRRVLSCVKMNLAPHPRSLTFQFGTDEANECARIIWTGECDHTADDLLSDTGNNHRGASPAALWLLKYMQECHGQAKPLDVLHDAVEAGFSRAQIQNARVALGIVSTKTTGSFAGGWLWILHAVMEEMPESSQLLEDPGT